LRKNFSFGAYTQTALIAMTFDVQESTERREKNNATHLVRMSLNPARKMADAVKTD